MQLEVCSRVITFVLVLWLEFGGHRLCVCVGQRQSLSSERERFSGSGGGRQWILKIGLEGKKAVVLSQINGHHR